MYCPMKFSIADKLVKIGEEIDCEKEKCAWWDFETTLCAILGIATVGITTYKPYKPLKNGEKNGK